MEGYELWRAVMYGVGVFVTCNVGGQLLIRLFAVRKRPAAPDCEPVRADERVTGEPYAVAYGGELVKVHGGQSFEEMRRQTEAGRRTDADDAPEESRRRTDGGLAPAKSGDASGESGTETKRPRKYNDDGTINSEWEMLVTAADGDSIPYGEGRYKLKEV